MSISSEGKNGKVKGSVHVPGGERLLFESPDGEDEVEQVLPDSFFGYAVASRESPHLLDETGIAGEAVGASGVVLDQFRRGAVVDERDMEAGAQGTGKFVQRREGGVASVVFEVRDVRDGQSCFSGDGGYRATGRSSSGSKSPTQRLTVL